MEKYKPTATLFLDTRVKKKSGKCPLKLTIYCNPLKRRYNTDIDLTPTEWEKVNSERLRDEELRKVKLKMSVILGKANKILENLIPFSFPAFEEQFFQNATNLGGLKLKDLFTSYAERHEKNGNVGTAISYATSYNSLNNFKTNLYLYDITVEFLERYEKNMLDKGKSVSTVGIYLRQLRAIYNDAISRKIINADSYPFGKNKYQIPAGRNVKKALTENDIQKLLNYNPENIEEERALDFWIFSYLCNGMNFCDIARLKPENIQTNFIYYIRSKTKNTKKADIKQIRVPIHPRANAILTKWRSNAEDGSYVFSILNDGLTPKAIKYRIQDFIKHNNKVMKAISGKLEISQQCNTYSCRHSFATILKRKNVSTEFISESLGHSSLQTTAAYLDSFEDETKLLVSNLLTEFNKAS